MATVREQVQAILDRVNDGGAVLFASMPDADGKADAYTIQCVGHREGATLKVDREVRHIGFGCFSAYVEGGYGKSEIGFDGGGAMYTVRGDDDDQPGFYLSWCILSGSQAQLDRMGYNPDVQRRYLIGLLATLA